MSAMFSQVPSVVSKTVAVHAFASSEYLLQRFFLPGKQGGHLSFWGLATLLDSVRAKTMRFNSSYIRNEIEDITGPLTGFIVTEHTSVTDRLYQLASDKRNCQLLGNTEVVDIGSTSYSVKSNLFESEGAPPISCGTLKLVLMEPVNHTPFKVPEEIKQKYSSLVGTAYAEKLTFTPLVVPNNAYVLTIVPRPTEEDGNLHVTHSAYFRYFYDAAISAAAANCYSGLGSEFRDYFVMDMRVWFPGESYAGDRLSVFTWNDQTEPLVVYFVVKNGDKIVTHCKWIVKHSDHVLLDSTVHTSKI